MRCKIQNHIAYFFNLKQHNGAKLSSYMFEKELFASKTHNQHQLSTLYAKLFQAALWQTFTEILFFHILTEVVWLCPESRLSSPWMWTQTVRVDWCHTLVLQFRVQKDRKTTNLCSCLSAKPCFFLMRGSATLGRNLQHWCFLHSSLTVPVPLHRSFLFLNVFFHGLNGLSTNNPLLLRLKSLKAALKL